MDFTKIHHQMSTILEITLLNQHSHLDILNMLQLKYLQELIMVSFQALIHLAACIRYQICFLPVLHVRSI